MLNKGRIMSKEEGVIKLQIALTKSVELQSHYAGLLNMYDGGERKQFASAEEWIQRLEKIGEI